eukprot:CAMPEP_0113595264 /NCGR_PEP_ID=MMETSP0015_2-20120614/39575_1 /TAXON_ID=2838 /ORGANISM="Odontella" /LENGTH=35 /DNA_ID=CAMNT_0000502431 /DNA_START=51 /DNA_END=155 /DNA_ORIENTATION=- /assembly_acc=CAM_ASM_000160
MTKSLIRQGSGPPRPGGGRRLGIGLLRAGREAPDL